MVNLPDCINLRQFPWMRAQIAQWCCDPKQAPSMYRMALNTVPVYASYPEVTQREHDLDEAHYKTFRSIRANGYAEALVKPEAHHDQYKLAYPGHPIGVGIQDNGALYVVDGTHRIFAQALLSDAPIWAKVVKRSDHWLDFVRRVYALNGDKNYFYHHLPHPDFEALTYQREETRFQRIRPWLLQKNVIAMTDYGCCTGSFAAECSDVVRYVQATERDPLYAEAARWRFLLQGCNNAFCGTGDLMTDNAQGDVAALLSVLHHVVAEHGMDATVDLLTRLATRYRWLLIEFPEEHEDILKHNPTGRAFAASMEEIMGKAGWKQERDFGLDPSFRPVPARRLILWGKKA